jgi:hypothetical protein
MDQKRNNQQPVFHHHQGQPKKKEVQNKYNVGIIWTLSYLKKRSEEVKVKLHIWKTKTKKMSIHHTCYYHRSLLDGQSFKKIKYK